ncbi:hypothetical protein EV421DRAFT_306209 [Armillaria borealis]|uniref:Uncharacterized protein n=1 Tax=Armillaria borealis TaxID=47425 RepID=A0AA39IVA9_9AGAR|nr:hypothetical protein EV421DRAFT_306209 [Armillaria borealis]
MNIICIYLATIFACTCNLMFQVYGSRVGTRRSIHLAPCRARFTVNGIIIPGAFAAWAIHQYYAVRKVSKRQSLILLIP